MAGLTIDGTDLSSFGLYLISYKIPAVPQIDSRDLKVRGRDGLIDLGADITQNEITITIGVEDETTGGLFDKVRAFTTFLHPRKGKRALIFSDDPGALRYIKLVGGTDIDKLKGLASSVGSYELKLKMTDPFTYSATPITIDNIYQNLGTAVFILNGTDTPFTAKVYCGDTSEFSPANGIGGVNSGDGSVMSNIKIDVNSDSYIKYTGAIYTGDELIFDTGKFKIFYDQENFLRYWEGDFPQLTTGANILQFSNQEGAPMHIIIEYRERWL